NLPPNSHVHHPQLSRADAPEPRGTTAQQPASKHVAVHKKRRAPVDRPSTSSARPSSVVDRRSRPFANLRRAMQNGTAMPGFNTLYPADKELIEEFLDAAEKGKKKFFTIRAYTNVLVHFSEWLQNQSKPDLRRRLRTDKNALNSDAKIFRETLNQDHLPKALTHLRRMLSRTDRTVKPASRRRHEAADGDKELIKEALSASPQYASVLRAFSKWLHAQKKDPLCKPGRLKSETLTDDVRAFVRTGMTGSEKLGPALRQLQIFKSNGKTDLAKRRSTRDILPDDDQLSEQYKAHLWESSGGKIYKNNETYAGKTSAYLRHFSAWLKANNKRTIASRLHDQTLDDDLDLYMDGKGATQRSHIIDMLTRVRAMVTTDVQPPNVQPHDLGNRAEPSGSSYSPLFPPTPSGGRPQLPHNWDLNMPAEEELAGPSGSAQSEPSSSTLAFNRDALHPEATGPQRTTAMSQASLPTFNEEDTGPN
ncbi:hypothetical protein, partial [Xanthomonas fragariae]|uniref:hypothetical protein n=3 Tax=Xanthomonas fragariae TaxID=48664 RepID=UPI0031B6980E